MEFSESTFNDIFVATIAVIETHPDTLALDPISDLLRKPLIQIPYTRKPKQNASSAFMTIKKPKKNWLGLLLQELTHFVTGASADVAVMHSSASAKSNSKRSQTWHQFVVELHADKIINRNDISEAQARQLAKLVDELSANGFKLKGCGKIEFLDETGKVL